MLAILASIRYNESGKMRRERDYSKMETQKRLTVRRLLEWAGLCALFVLTRAMLVLPWLLIQIPRRETLAMVWRTAASLLVWAAVVLPEHGFHCWYVMRMHGDDKAPYSYLKALKVGLYRTLRVCYAIVPALVMTLLLYYIMYSENFGSMKIFKVFGSVFGSQRSYGYDTGAVFMVALLLVFWALTAFLWYLHTPNDYLRTVRPLRKFRFDGRPAVSFLMAVAAYALWGVILYRGLHHQMQDYDKFFEKVIHISKAVKDMLKQRSFRLEMALVLVLVYCPLWCLRKNSAARAAAALK